MLFFTEKEKQEIQDAFTGTIPESALNSVQYSELSSLKRGAERKKLAGEDGDEDYFAWESSQK